MDGARALGRPFRLLLLLPPTGQVLGQGQVQVQVQVQVQEQGRRQGALLALPRFSL